MFPRDFSEAVARRCSVKKMFLEISQNSQENNCARVSLLIKLQASCEFCELSKNTFSYRTPPVAASYFLLKSSFISVSSVTSK